MEHVTIVGAEDHVLVLATESGERFALPIDEVLRTELRRAKAGREEKAAPLAASPREIQSHIRAGMSAADVAELLGVSLEVVERFEGPVLAEREHIVGQALAVPVLIGSEVEPDAQPTFGVAIRAKLADLAADSERWVELEGGDGLDHQARVHRQRGRPRRALELRPAAQRAGAAQLRRRPALPPGCAAGGAHPPAARAGQGAPVAVQGRHPLRLGCVRTAAGLRRRPRLDETDDEP